MYAIGLFFVDKVSVVAEILAAAGLNGFDTVVGEVNDMQIFIYGDMNISMEEAKKVCVKQDKKRQSYYNYYSDKKWGRADSYDICIDSGKLGVEGTVDMIIDYVKRLEA